MGDRTIAFLLMDKEMYSGMSCLSDLSPAVERGIALHKVFPVLQTDTVFKSQFVFMWMTISPTMGILFFGAGFSIIGSQLSDILILE